MTIRTAIIGFGVGGSVFHAPLLAADPRFAITAIVTADPSRAATAHAHYAGAAVLPSANELFARGDVDLVIITTPNATHAPLARGAIAAGAAVVIDKPIGLSSGEAESLIGQAAAAGTPLTVFQNRRWDGDFLTVRENIDSGELGQVRQFDSAFEWWAPTLTDRWKDTATPQEGGGILFDLGPHLIDQALTLFGDVVDVQAQLDTRRPGGASDDDALLLLTHSNGVRSRLWMSAIAPANRPRFRVSGSRAVFQSDGLDPQEAQSIAGMRPGDAGFGIDRDKQAAAVHSPAGTRAVTLLAGEHLTFYRQLGDALLSGAALPVDPRDSVRALQIIESVRTAAS